MMRRSMLVTASAAGVLALAAAWSYGYMAAQRAAATAAKARAEQCLTSAAAIESLRRAPVLASDRERLISVGKQETDQTITLPPQDKAKGK